MSVITCSWGQTLWTQDNAPTPTNAIPSIDYIDKHLATEAMNTALNPAIHVAVGYAKHTINHYYDKSNMSAAYHIAMSNSQYLLWHAYHNLPAFDKSSTPATNFVTSPKMAGWTHGLMMHSLW